MYELDFSRVDDVESGIRVAFNKVITVPVKIRGKESHMVIYVGVTELAATDIDRRGRDAALGLLLMDVAGRLALVKEA